MASERPAQPGELCTCGRPAEVVFINEQGEATGWCGLSDGGAKGQCLFCGDPDGHEFRCPSYVLKPTPQDTHRG
jgi:hypothetical protein